MSIDHLTFLVITAFAFVAGLSSVCYLARRRLAVAERKVYDEAFTEQRRRGRPLVWAQLAFLGLGLLFLALPLLLFRSLPKDTLFVLSLMCVLGAFGTNLLFTWDLFRSVRRRVPDCATVLLAVTCLGFAGCDLVLAGCFYFGFYLMFSRCGE